MWWCIGQCSATYRTKVWRISVVYTTKWCCKRNKNANEFRSRYAMFVNRCNINNGDYHVRRRFDRELRRIPVKKLEKFSRKNKQIKKLVCRRILKNIPVSSKMYRYIKCRLRTRSNNDSIKFVQKMRKKWHSTRSTLNRKSSSCRESLGKSSK